MEKKIVLRASFCFLSISVMAVIFWFSSQTGEQSATVSNNMTEKILTVLYPGFGGLPLIEKNVIAGTFSVIIRKTAHFTIFMLLGFAVYSFLINYRIKSKNVFKFAVIFCVFYAITDEIHQYFVDGRVFQLLDILIDSAGALVGILITIQIIKNMKAKKAKII